MNNKKCKVEASVADLIKSKKYETSENSVNDLIKPKKKYLYETETSVTSVTDLLKPKKKYLYPCDCICCNGAEVDSRTRKKHMKDEILWKSEDTRKNQENTIMARKQKKSSIEIHDANPAEKNLNISKKRKRDSHHASSPNFDPFQLINEEPDPFQQNDEENIHTLFSSTSSKSSCFHIPAPTPDKNNNDDNYFDEEDNDEYNVDQEEGCEDEDIENDENDDNDDNVDEFFASPEIDSDEIFVTESLNDSIETEIIIWIFKFQQRFRLSDIALEALIKFLCIVLTRSNKSQFKNFPNSLYMAKKMLNIFQPKMQLAVCSNCHRLHNVKEIIAYKEDGKVATMNCLHEEYPNNSHSHKCNNPLSTLSQKKGVTIPVPRLLYPRPSIRHQLSMLYQRPDFENMLKLSGIRREDNIYSDIYDGEIWKTFPFDGNTFFTPDTATTHLGLFLNLDWFQPFTYTQHSTGAIYASICNLPRSERDKPENILYLGFLPGPKEVGLERINHYLAPIVDELLELWRGWKVPKTYQCSDGYDIKVALIIGSSDTPATRKLFGHRSAVMKCHRCEKRSTYSESYRKTHYGRMHEHDEWVTNLADPSLHRQYAHEWLQCNSKSSRDAHFKEHGVRWSELLRLPYMDPIRFAVVDPMHCLFLGVAKWIIKSIFINQNKLSMEQLRIAQKRMDHFDLPSDIGRIPPKIAIGNEGFSNLTADQWKTFIMIYSTTILWDMLDNDDRKILGHFVRACNLLVARFITEDDLKEAQERLRDMAYLIENTYGPEFITSNIHLALHIPDCCRDYGPIYSFWLFPFERLNGYIGKILTLLWYFAFVFFLKIYFLLFRILS